MKKTRLLFLIIMTSVNLFSQVKKQNKPPLLPSISNIKLGLNENYILEKFTSPTFDTIINSTRIINYKKIKLENNYEIENVIFSFFKEKLFSISFIFNDEIHAGLIEKYGYKNNEERLGGTYGNFNNDIVFWRIKNENYDEIFLVNKSLQRISESEGF